MWGGVDPRQGGIGGVAKLGGKGGAFAQGTIATPHMYVGRSSRGGQGTGWGQQWVPFGQNALREDFSMEPILPEAAVRAKSRAAI